MATVKISKARNVIWSSDMSYVAIISKHSKSFQLNVDFTNVVPIFKDALQGLEN